MRKKGQVVHVKETENTSLVTHLFYRLPITLTIIYGSKQDCQDKTSFLWYKKQETKVEFDTWTEDMEALFGLMFGVHLEENKSSFFFLGMHLWGGSDNIQVQGMGVDLR